MAEPIHALPPLSARRPASRKPRIPHPHLAPAEPKVREQAPAAPQGESWTPAAVPMARPAGRPRRRSTRTTPSERLLRYSLRFGFFVNGAALVIPRLLPASSFRAWSYGGDDFLLAGAVLLSGQALLMLGRSAPPCRDP